MQNRPLYGQMLPGTLRANRSPSFPSPSPDDVLGLRSVLRRGLGGPLQPENRPPGERFGNDRRCGRLGCHSGRPEAQPRAPGSDERRHGRRRHCRRVCLVGGRVLLSRRLRSFMQVEMLMVPVRRPSQTSPHQRLFCSLQHTCTECTPTHKHGISPNRPH